MNFLRRFFSQKRDRSDSTVNSNRTNDLYKLTADGYVIAQDIACQYEYIQQQPCPHCGGQLDVAAQLNRASQGLNELVCTCQHCQRRSSLIFDVSNTVYQEWMAKQLGDLYIRNYDGPPRIPADR